MFFSCFDEFRSKSCVLMFFVCNFCDCIWFLRFLFRKTKTKRFDHYLFVFWSCSQTTCVFEIVFTSFSFLANKIVCLNKTSHFVGYFSFLAKQMRV